MHKSTLILINLLLIKADYPCTSPSCSSYTPCSSCQRVDCEWSPWSWSSCSTSCGRGRESGTRSILRKSRNGGQPCGSVVRATRDCQGPPCPVDCVWGDWTDWACSGTWNSDSSFNQLNQSSLIKIFYSLPWQKSKNHWLQCFESEMWWRKRS